MNTQNKIKKITTMKCQIESLKDLKKLYKKLSSEHKELFSKVSLKLANNEILEPKYHDHALKGKYIALENAI